MRKERSEQELVRFEKLAALRAQGNPYPNGIKVSATCQQVLEAEELEPARAERFEIAGRLVQLRVMGKAAFGHLLDGSGRLQIYVKSDEIGSEAFDALKHYDLGDILYARGYAFRTKTGEKSLHCEDLKLLVKSLIPPPEKWHGLSDVEIRYRQRYVDLIANPEVREIFRTRSRIIKEIREFLDARGYLEVETPVLHYIPGGATARPFKTRHNALGCDMYLRIALELPLKKLVVGGFERVYEIGRVFRNEGLSKKHNPEFTMVEFYQAHATYEDLMDLTEELIVGLVQRINGSLQLEFGECGIDFTPPWKRVSMVEACYQFGSVDRSFDLSSMQGVLDACSKYGVDLSEFSGEDRKDWGRCLEQLWSSTAEAAMINPVFLIEHPSSISPLARKNDLRPEVTDRFELIIAGMEMANAFSELNDPIDQRQRFEVQAQRRAGGDEEAADIDEDFLRSLEYGLPPTAGEGIGIDRLVMLLTNSASIRDVILFPQLKPEDS